MRYYLSTHYPHETAADASATAWIRRSQSAAPPRWVTPGPQCLCATGRSEHRGGVCAPPTVERRSANAPRSLAGVVSEWGRWFERPGVSSKHRTLIARRRREHGRWARTGKTPERSGGPHRCSPPLRVDLDPLPCSPLRPGTPQARFRLGAAEPASAADGPQRAVGRALPVGIEWLADARTIGGTAAVERRTPGGWSYRDRPVPAATSGCAQR